MGLLAPLALVGLLSVPVILAFYVLRLRREERPVSSTYLWQALVRDVEANAPWQRLRRSLLLLLQLLLALLLVLLVARPALERPAGLSHDLVLVIDASASMSARDVFPDRLSAARQAAINLLSDLPAGGRVSVIEAAETARVVVNEASDPGRAARAIERIEPSVAVTDLADALKLAGALAARAEGAEIVVVTDDAGAAAPRTAVDAPIRAVLVGRSPDNQGLAGLAVHADAAGLERSLFVSVTNHSPAIVWRRLQVLADGEPFTARDLQLDSLSRTDVIIEDLPRGARVLEARLTSPTGSSDDGEAGPADVLPLDDVAWALAPDDRLRRVLLVGPGNVFLQNAFALLPNVELYGVTPDEWPTTTGKDRFDLFVFDGFLPDELPDRPILAISPPRTSALGEVTGSAGYPDLSPPSADEPLLRNVDLTRLHVARAQRLGLPAWARPVFGAGPDLPLLYSGLREGLPTAVLAFDLRESDLGLQVAWPVLLSNLTGELLGLGQAARDAVAPATPVELPLRPGVAGLRVTLPDGSTRELSAGARGASTVTFTGARQLGVHHVEELPGEPPAGASPVAGAVGPAPAGPGSLDFAVDLFAAQESDVEPGDGRRLEALGSAGAGATGESGTALDEWWPLLASLALLLLMAEWALYERDGARRLWGAGRSAVRGMIPARVRR